MAALERVGDMTREELERVIVEVIRRDARPYPYTLPGDGRSFDEVFQSIVENVIELPPGAPSTRELIREERDR